MCKGESKWRNLQELGSQCRILSLLTLVVFGFGSVALIVVCSTALGDGLPKYDMSKLQEGDDQHKPQRDNVNLLIALTILSILFSLASISMFIASFIKNMWMTIPYWIMILAMIGLYLYQLLYYGFCIGKCQKIKPDKIENTTNPLEPSTEFTNNVVDGGGGSYIVSSLLMLALLCYAFIPSFAFFWQCKNKRAAELKSSPPPPSTTPPSPVESGPVSVDD